VTTLNEKPRLASPWPGPRPFSEDERDLLFSREADLRAFGATLRTRQVVQLSAMSGAGKTSFLQAKLIPAMREAGYLPLLHRAWGTAGLRAEEAHGAPRGVSLYHAALRAAVESEVKDGNVAAPKLAGATLDQDLRTLIESRKPSQKGVVLVFDQVEELFRRDFAAGRQFISEVTRVAKTFPIHQVVSLRDEYVAALLPMHGDLGSLAAQSSQLEELTDEESLRAVIMRPPALPEFGVTVTEEACSEILSWWTQARQVQLDAWSPDAERASEEAAEELGATSVGLLHLQGVLWSLYRFWSDPARPHCARDPKGATRPEELRKVINKEDVLRFAETLLSKYSGAGSQSVPAATLAEQAAVPVVAESLYRWVDAAFEPLVHDGERPWRQHSVRDIAARMAVHLSAGGYKNTQTFSQLADLCIADDMIKLGIGFKNVTAVLPTVLEELGEAEDERPEPLAERLERLEAALAKGLNVDPSLSAFGRIAGQLYLKWADQIRGQTVPDPDVDGPALLATAQELLVAFGLASYFLRAAHILREPPSIGTTRMVELVHDGFGPAFKRWAAQYERGPVRYVRSLVVVGGKDLVWERFTPAELGGKRVAGLCWVGCWISGPGSRRMQMQNVTFEDCKFSGSFFSGIDLTNVTFKNCDFKGVLFQRCNFNDVTFEIGIFDGAAFKDVSSDQATFREITANDLTFEAVSGGPWKFEKMNVLHGLVRAGTNGSMFQMEVTDSLLSHWHFDAAAFKECGISQSVLLYATVTEGPPFLSIDGSELVAVHAPEGIITHLETTTNHPAPEIGGARPTLTLKPAEVDDPWRMGR